MKNQPPTPNSSKSAVLLVGLITALGGAALATAASASAGSMAEGSAAASQMQAQPSSGDVTINVMKHECDADLVKNLEEFETVDTNGNGVHEFVDTVLACPTMVMPGDEQANGALAFPDKKDFQFEVEDDLGVVQNLDTSTYIERQVCESEEASQDDGANTVVLGADISGDGDTDDCLDTSLYQVDNVANGTVNVTETEPPFFTRPGALEFTPQAVNENNDNETLEEELREVFVGDSIIELDTTRDDNGVVTLHVYNFPNCPTTSATAEDGPQNNLTWTSVDGADSYQIYRQTAGGGFTELALVDGNTTTYEDTDVEQGDSYRYQVTAINDAGEESQVCNTAAVTAVPVFSSSIALASAALLGIAGYAIVRRRS